ncbi:hypothetical protein HDU82_001009, partial [Entophlyctis luteolus]
IFCGGFLTVFFYTTLPGHTLALPIGLAQIAAGAIIMALEHPFKFWESMGPVYTSFIPRILFYIACMVPSVWEVPAQTGALCLAYVRSLCGILTYIRAVIAGESGGKKGKGGGGKGGDAKGGKGGDAKGAPEPQLELFKTIPNFLVDPTEAQVTDEAESMIEKEHFSRPLC